MTYHHGDLRNALIQTGTEMLAEEGVAGLSLRKLAKRVGVSHNAPYQHFADKDALIASIAEQGFRMLIAAIQEEKARIEDQSPLARIYASRAYVRFGLEHPAHLQVMFRAYDSEKFPDLAQAAMDGLGTLISVIAHGQETGDFIEGDPLRLATMVWSMLHGMSSIMIARRMPPGVLTDYDQADELVDEFMTHVLNGLKRRD